MADIGEQQVGCEMTYEELAAFAAGDLDARRHSGINDHLLRCERCRDRIDALGRADEALAELVPAKPSPRAVADVRQALSQAIRTEAPPQVMTLEQVAMFLQITADQLGEIAETLPAFELAGQIRVRRVRLVEWIEQRERDYSRNSAASSAAQAKSTQWRIAIA